MKLTCEDHDRVSVMHVGGDVTADEIGEFRKLAQDRMKHGIRDFVLDLRDVSFIDSQGLETLLWLQEAAGENLGQVRLVALTDNVNKIFEITRLAPCFECLADVPEALESLQ